MKIEVIPQYRLKVARQPSAMLSSAVTSLTAMPGTILPVLAGGAVRDCLYGRTPTDYDIFFITTSYIDQIGLTDLEQRIANVSNRLMNAGARKVFECPENMLTTFDLNGTKVQLINRMKAPYRGVKELFDSFDFHVCQFAFYGNSVYLTREAVKSMMTKRLTLHKLTYPSATINRLAKYKDKGFFTGECIGDIVDTLGQVTPEQYAELFSDDTLYVD